MARGDSIEIGRGYVVGGSTSHIKESGFYSRGKTLRFPHYIKSLASGEMGSEN